MNPIWFKVSKRQYIRNYIISFIHSPNNPL